MKIRFGKMKKKHIILILICLGLILIGLAGYFTYNFINERNKNDKNPEEMTLIDKYRQKLPDLKRQASSGKAEDLQNYGIALYATGDIVGAEKTFRQEIEKDSNSVMAHSGLANALRDQKKYDEAIAEYKKVIELSPNSISAYVNLTSVYQYSLKQMDEAVKIYKQGIDKNPNSKDLYLLLGMAYEQSNDKVSAKASYDKVMTIEKDNPIAKTALERLAQ